LHTFAGPVPILAPLMFPIEIVSHISRIISLSFRLFGNIKGDDLFLWVLLMLVPYLSSTTSISTINILCTSSDIRIYDIGLCILAGAVLMEEERSS